MTDSLSAGAVSGAGFSVPQAAVQSLEVGSDMILFNAAPQDVPRVTRRVVRAIVRPSTAATCRFAACGRRRSTC